MSLTLEQARHLARIVLNRRVRGLPPIMEIGKGKFYPPPIPTSKDKALPPLTTQSTKPAASPTPPTLASTENAPSAAWAQAIVDNLNRNVLAEHEADLATLPPAVRASKTPAQWLKVPALEIMRLAREQAKAK